MEGPPEITLHEGKQYTIRGNFVRFSETGFIHERGLLQFRAYRPADGEPWVYPPGAHWHPHAIEMREKAERGPGRR